MSRGVGYGGGRSSLGYLFGSGEQPPAGNDPPPSPSKLVPPYGTHIEEENQPTANTPVDQKQDNSNSNYQRPQGQNSGNSVTERPATKVKSVPGGNSSLGYLFGDK